MFDTPKSIVGLATAFKWATRLLAALYVAAIAAPFLIFGLTDNSIILSSLVAMGVPTVLTCLYIFGGTVARALGPAAEALLSLAKLIWQIGCMLFGRRS